MNELGPGAVVAERFVVERLAGAGGMGSVYAAHDRVGDTRVALKVLRTLGPDDTLRFRREAEVLRVLAHPGIVRYVAHGEWQGTPFLAMEWVDGEDLGERLARAPLGPDEVMALGRALADALALVHERGVVHRDLKPSNVRLSARGPVLVDFGVARARDLGPASVTRTGAIVGTPLTMAPEQARGLPDVDARADVFALGAVLHECLTGVPPFAASNLVAVLARILLDSVPPPSERAPAVPPALDALVLRLLEKDPHARPANGAEVRRLLDDVAAGVGLTPPIPSRRGLSLEETRYATCVVVRGLGPLEPTLVADRTQVDDRALRGIAESHGALLERLADGSLVALVLGGARDEQVARAARCALALCEATGMATALAAGRATTGTRIPVGDAIDHALAVLEAAEPREVRVDRTTAEVLRARFVVTPCGEHARVGPSVEGATRTVRGRATPFVGRRRELTSLGSLVGEAFEERSARFARVLAAPGLGKSRLAGELRDRLVEDQPEAVVLLLVADDGLAASPNAFARSLALALLVYATPEPEQRPFARDLAGLVQDPVDDALVALVRNDAGARRGRHVRALASLLRTLGQRGLALLVDDAQWIDEASASMIDGALAQGEAAALALIAFARPEGSPLFAGREVEELRLSPLAARAAEELARHVLGASAAPERVARAVEAASGHPLLLEEILRAGPEASGDDVIALVQARIAQLPPDARVVLRAVSILGARACEGAVAALVDRERSSVRGSIDACVRAELLERGETSRLDTSPELRFRHALMRDAAYAMLTEADRTLGHKLALAWLETHRERDRLLLAEHAVRAARDPLEHAAAGDRFCEAALLAPRHQDGVAALARAREQLALAAASSTGTRLAGKVARAQAYWIARGGNRVAARERLDAAVAAAREASDEISLAALLATRAWTSASIGDAMEDVEADLAEAERLARSDPEARFWAAKARANVAFFAHDLERAITLTDGVVAMARELGSVREESTFLHNAAEWRIRAGRLDDVEAILGHSSASAESIGEMGIVHLNGALLGYVRAVRLGAAMPEGELAEMGESGRRFGAVDLAWEEITCRTFHAHALAHAGRTAASREAFEALRQRATEIAMPNYVAAASRAIAALDAGGVPALG